MDPDTESLLVSTCLALGGFEDISSDMNDDRQVYIMGDECLGCLKDIKKFIKYYDEPGDNVVLTFLGKMNILEKDLIPIMLLNSPAEGNPVKERIILACIELIVPMTWIIDYKELQRMVTAEEDDSMIGNLHQRLETLRGYKRAFLKPGVLQTVLSVMMKPLDVSERMRTTRDHAIIRLGLSLFRNLVAIPDAESAISGTMDQFISSIMQEELIVRFDKEGINALLIFLSSSASSPKYTEFNSMTLEILYYIYSGIDAEDLVSTITDGTRMVLHQRGALFTSFESQLDTIKKPRARTKRHKETDDYKKTLTKNGLRQLRALAETLLEDCYNALFGSLRRDIEMQREKVKDHHRAQYHYMMAFMLKFQRLYLEHVNREYEHQKKTATPQMLDNIEKVYKASVHKCDFDLIASAIEVPCVFQLIRFIRFHMEPKPKDRSWEDIRKAMNCFQEMLMTLYAMVKSPNEDYRDASDIVQNNLYYEDATLELFLDLAKHYTTQSTAYLHTLVRMIHILLKTLENYSNSKSHMFILKKRAIKKRKDAQEKAAAEKDKDTSSQSGDAAPEEQPMDDVQQDNREQDDNSEDEDALPTHTMQEHQFVFKEFERRFANEAVVHTYYAFLENYESLDETQLHWAAAMFHRIAVNARNMAVFYKLSVLQLFHQILQSGRPDTKRDMAPFISYLLHQFFKKLQEYPLLMVEVLFPKTSKVCLDINVGRDEAEKQKKMDVMTEKKEKRLMETELKVDPERPESEQIKIAVTALIDEDERELVEWVVLIIKEAIEKRQLMTFRSESELAENPDLMFSVENVEDIPVVPDNPARQQAIRLMPRFRLLLKLLHFTMNQTEHDGIQYIIPKDLPTDTLSEYQDMIDAILEEDPENFSHYDYSALITKINKSAKKKPSSGTGAGRVRAPKEPEVYRSSEYVIDSEDEDDQSYFEAEKRLRERVYVEFEQAEERHRRQEAENARSKSQKKKQEILKRAAGMKQTHSIQSSSKVVGTVALTDDEEEDEAPEAGRESTPPLFIATSFGFSDSEDEEEKDEDREEKESRRAVTSKMVNDVESDAESDDSGNAYRLSRTLPRQQYGVRRAAKPAMQLTFSDDDDNDDDEDSTQEKDDTTEDQATQPLSLTQRLAAQTGQKRRIILEDSDEDEGDEALEDDLFGVGINGRTGDGNSNAFQLGSDDRPAKKKFAMDE
ncbi:Topoisomerase 1-associated factor 1 [Mortierella claussenii]|nr:Topoisomerase 1-associated factor 1 [Mortierella claussenii]